MTELENKLNETMMTCVGKAKSSTDHELDLMTQELTDRPKLSDLKTTWKDIVEKHISDIGAYLMKKMTT